MDNYQFDNNDNHDNNNQNNGWNSQNGQNNGQNYNNYTVKERNNLGTASMIFGILSLFGCITVWFGLIFAIAAIVLAILSRSRMGRFEGGAVGGLITGIISVIISLMLYFMILQLIQSPDFVNYLNQYMGSLPQTI